MSTVPRLGAWHESNGVAWRVWAPSRESLEVVLFKGDGVTELRRLPLMKRGEFFEGRLSIPPTPTLYKIAIDGNEPVPDPWSRAQPFGVHGPSEVVRPDFPWADAGWRGVPLDKAVIYEVHVGTATQEGTFEALISKLSHIRDLGANFVELLPVASFPGARNWGYDGVDLFAPAAVYGGPDGLRRLIDAAHKLGLGVLQDVVYNHFGPDGNYLRCYEPNYFTDRHKTPWGDGINYDGPQSAVVRELVLSNAEMWIRDFHMDGLRLDATHAIVDDSPIHILREIGERAHAAAKDRTVLVIAEDERNERRLVRPTNEGGYGLDAVWADDFHHAARRLLIGDTTGCCEDFAGTLDELARIVRCGWLYEGQPSKHHGKARGTSPEGIDRTRFVFCIQNHDQIGNRAFGERLFEFVSPAAYKAMTALLLMAPETPLLFMGQEWNARTPFLFFTDHHAELGQAVTKGRHEELRKLGVTAKELPDPQASNSFEQSKLDWTELDREEHRGVLEWHRVLLKMRSEYPSAPQGTRIEMLADGTLRLVRGALTLLITSERRPPSAGLLASSDEPRFGGGSNPIAILLKGAH